MVFRLNGTYARPTNLLKYAGICSIVLLVVAVCLFLYAGRAIKAVRVEVSEQFDANFHPIDPPRRWILTGNDAQFIADLFPGAGSRRPLARYSAFTSRYKIAITDRKGNQVVITIDYSLNYWQDKYGGMRPFSPDAATKLTSILEHSEQKEQRK